MNTTLPAETVDEEKPTLVKGYRTQLKNGAFVAVSRLSDGGCAMDFEFEGSKTPLRLSAEAMQVVMDMWTTLTWGSP